VLDYGGGSASNHDEAAVNSQYATTSDIGKMKGDLKGLEIASPSIIEDELDNDSFTNQNQNKNKNQKVTSTGGGGLFSSFKSLVGSKTLTADMIKPAMDKMQEHLVSKNVAMEIAQKICANVAVNLEGKQMGSFQFVASQVKRALSESIIQILTPKKRVDILRDVYESRRLRKPYVIVFCGVNGVGKSTNLAKVTFWLIENSFRVLIAACDTFRSGAVEQLRTHSRHLNALHPVDDESKPMVELYEKGYGKDAAAIAHEAINYARDSNHDVVLVDTAGRMQDNEPLMKALAKLININNPDLVLFVGEALVGNEAVDQVRKFNQALIDNSSLKTATTADKARTIDGIVLTKFDTIDDKVGAAVSMTYITGQPIVFVGTGQTYSDLKSLNAESVVQSLLK
jgi:signal recognition particle receptor subunit alpha